MQSILSEDESGGNPAMFGGGGMNAYDSQFAFTGGGGSGAFSVGGSDLAKTFLEPFTDVLKTGKGAAKELGARAKTLVSTVVGTAVTTLVPFLSRDYNDLFEEEEEKISKIRGEYKDAMDRTDAALGGPDAKFLALMASPGTAIAAVTAKEGPKVAKELLSVITGGYSDDVFDTAKSGAKAAGRWALGGSSKDDNSRRRRRGESQLREEDDEKSSGDKKKGGITPEKILKSEKFLSKSLDNSETKKMQKIATKIYRETLNSAYGQAENVLKKVKTLEDVQKLAAKGDSDVKKKLEDLKKLPQKEKDAAADIMIKGLRSATKEMYVKKLEDTVKAVVGGGIPEDSQFVKDYKDVIAKIKAL